MNIIVLGNGGHSKVIQDMLVTLGDYELIAVLDDKYQESKEENGVIYGPFSLLTCLLNQDVKAVIAVGNNAIRKKLAGSLPLRPDQYVSIIAPTAVVSPTAMIGNGSVVMPNAVINAEASIGRHCIINTGAIVEHENTIGDYVHVSPHATLTGNVLVNEGVHIGASATVIPSVEIGSWSIVGAGSTIITPIPSYCKAVGTPARVIEQLLINERKSS
ncbi:acetyltransferase [Domibacillus mangrovi]|uniref:Acetyltransferase n=1 Tax=Domibacillus mangrovi TaxID=1714354 RepID=A0A1Q5P2S9_9BACI|nr:acetyltransferase [Domibacillus mangrovi]OKL36554.1 acetyltransferase [Domibacillus mangrovi]